MPRPLHYVLNPLTLAASATKAIVAVTAPTHTPSQLDRFQLKGKVGTADKTMKVRIKRASAAGTGTTLTAQKRLKWDDTGTVQSTVIGTDSTDFDVEPTAESNSVIHEGYVKPDGSYVYNGPSIIIPPATIVFIELTADDAPASNTINGSIDVTE